jgi:hypothetical protein
LILKFFIPCTVKENKASKVNHYPDASFHLA